MASYKLLFYLSLITLLSACNSSEEKNRQQPLQKKKEIKNADPRNISTVFKDYWYSGKAEITSYNLQQERYGELRTGTAVTIFVTENFLPEKQVKTNSNSEKNISVLKLNQTKNFNTGIYPYSIMNSVFSPITHTNHALKLSTSVQEWCGQTYMQLNNRGGFQVKSHSYFEGEADQQVSLKKSWLESELWNLIRINPDELPTGDLKIIPSLEYLRLQHKEIKQYNAIASLKRDDSISVYTLHYEDIPRKLNLYFNTSFPHEIEKWESIQATAQNDTVQLQTIATKLKRIRTDYWNQNRNEFTHLRDSLGLK
ncbi:septum formation inhibitor Maf [Aequorivita marina]|uniref:septum formation inhibitor Maf n=1 Tax=Aequorivita marina TaxID=3073654 RepID=UPI0028740B71|nr:septum formation inhibitor Maf [Aequorivita sp. S2608]MDS1298820.1 septum formation inhibitor Maf [Aequorivita sp. S2608]